MQNIDKPGFFYLGKTVDPSTGKPTEDVLLYPSKNLTTHAVCMGMTGSGKTGLGIGLLEEAGLNKIPAIIIDPKGDLGNLLLTFPHLTAQEFRPWIDEVEAERRGIEPEAYADEVAKNWREGLAKWGEGAERIQKFKESVEISIYTPANNGGIPLSILSSFAVPSKELMEDAGAFRDRIMSLSSSLLGLLGMDADPIKSREHILISTIIEQAWREGTSLDIAKLIQRIQNPPFDKIGALDIDTFFNQKERTALSINLNNLLASPGFQAWMEGEPLDISKLLYTDARKPKFSILSIAHLSDAERMFFVTLLLNEIISWMRNQPGTSELRALLYMDEVFGYFPPIAAPPSKAPMLTLLKQARAYGLGIVLATQNPVDLDYKGLSNCGTWFIGKLQTERDRARVCEGLKIASNGEIEVNAMDKMLSTIANRMFILRSIYLKEPLLFTTRWTMSYLRGPLTLNLIKNFPQKKWAGESLKTIEGENKGGGSDKPMLPSSITEIFVNAIDSAQQKTYVPRLLGIAKLHFVDAKNKIDLWQEISLLAPADPEGKTVLWKEGEDCSKWKERMSKIPLPDLSFAAVPRGLMQEKNYQIFQKEFSAYLYQNQEMNIYSCSEIGLSSKEGESEEDFKSRVMGGLNEKREGAVEKIRAKYGEKKNSLTTKIRLAQEKLVKQQHKAGWQKFEAFLSFGATLLGAIFGRGVTKGTISQAGTSIRRAGKIGMESQGASQAEENYLECQKQLEALQKEMQEEIDKISAGMDPKNVVIETIIIRPRKSDLSVEKVAVAWVMKG